ncbi:uncharacterized protein EI97DRAFT_107240 [Westerdykella ornata]|uniref:BZIP domain-containing protein n=1 Tax=Westerdykella ornata TaxID=318751 RepID=A0A6A6JUR9_WESOR|nr:uncharacterized protein EI97DRAFT_107240 [Westerdykella ornata]KAF2279985.1 hypothetical protein EI97DRAFT_107240 [Westerdykella ornata]
MPAGRPPKYRTEAERSAARLEQYRVGSRNYRARKKARTVPRCENSPAIQGGVGNNLAPAPTAVISNTSRTVLAAYRTNVACALPRLAPKPAAVVSDASSTVVAAHRANVACALPRNSILDIPQRRPTAPIQQSPTIALPTPRLRNSLQLFHQV